MLANEQDIILINSVSVGEILESPDLTRLVLKTYSVLFGCKNPKFCTKSIRDYKTKIGEKGLEILKINSMPKKYLLKKDITLYDSANKCSYTRETITDEISEKLLKNNPKLSVNFEKIPKLAQNKIKK